MAALSAFRSAFYAAISARADAVFELTDAVLEHEGQVDSPPGLSLEGAFTRGHGSVYGAVNAGRIDPDSVRSAALVEPLPRMRGHIVLAVDVSPWLRPDAECSPERLFCHVYGRGRGSDQTIPGWPYSFLVAQTPGASSWVVPLSARRFGPDDDVQEATASQVRAVVVDLVNAGQWAEGDRPIILVTDAGYVPARMAWQLDDLPVVVCSRVPSDRVYYGRAEPKAPGAVGPRPRHGRRHECANPATWSVPDGAVTVPSTRYGQVRSRFWRFLHPKLTGRSAWVGHDGPLPVVEGTVVRLEVDHLPHQSRPDPVNLWISRADLEAAMINTVWFAWLRRFDQEHFHRFIKQDLGWTVPAVRDPRAADTWTVIVMAVYLQLWLARDLVADHRLPWERPALPGHCSPRRVRRGLRNLRGALTRPANVAKPTRPGPGRPKGAKNRRRAARHDPGKQTRRPGTNGLGRGNRAWSKQSPKVNDASRP
ncbi:NF041680 family putative transposase [Glycomyces sambucus]|uniref:NF041680 family putative transposase n=1 Tax=Glycomyces sambucus TaxID=380244 RepID=UPI000B8A30E6